MYAYMRAAFIAAGLAFIAGSAHATLALTGAVPGFTLTTAIGGYPFINSGTYTLVSVGVAGNGDLIAPANGGPMYVFNDADNQTLASAISTVPLPPGNGFVMAELGGQVYGSQALGGGFYTFNNNGTISTTIPVVGATSLYGLWGDAANNTLLASSNLGLIQIDPTTGNYVVVNSLAGYGADGVTVTPDGTVAYIADYITDRVRGYSLVPGPNFGQQIFTTSVLGHGSDGMGVLAGTCGLAGDIVVNNNDGTVGLIDPSSGLETTIASGGNRGDFASADPNNGSLLLSQNDQIARLMAPTGCSLGYIQASGGGSGGGGSGGGGSGGGGSGGTQVPEPAAYLVILSGTVGLAAARRRKTSIRAT